MTRPVDDPATRPLFSVDDLDDDATPPPHAPPPPPRKFFTHIRDTHAPPSLWHIRINRFLFTFFPRFLFFLLLISLFITLLPGGWRVGLCAANLVPAPVTNLTLVGHRGCEWPYPENSVQAFRHAEPYVGMVEVDLALTSDAVVIAMHDDVLNRTTNGTGVPCMRDSAYIRGLRLRKPERDAAGNRAHAPFCEVHSKTGSKPCTYRVPTLGEVLDDLPQKMRYMLDVKECYAEGMRVGTPRCTNCTLLAEKTKEALSSNFIQHSQIVFTSTQAASLKVFRKIIPDAKFAISLSTEHLHYKRSTFEREWKEQGWDGASVHLVLAAARPDLVDIVRRISGSEMLFVYTVRSNWQYNVASCTGVRNLIVADAERVSRRLIPVFDPETLTGENT